MDENKELEIPIVTLEDDLGNEEEFEVLDVVEFENDEYVVLLPTDEEANDVVILLVESLDDEDEQYVGIDDDELLDKVFEVFKKLHPEFDYE